MKKERLDVAMVERGLAPSRSAAQVFILAGDVRVNDGVITKASHVVTADDLIEVGSERKYVSRGGYKLEKAMEVFPVDLKGKTCLDIGASTGGFTHCMLLNGAEKCYSIDVGYGQLDYSLRSDDRVVCMERYNARNLNVADIGGSAADFASIDVSFISLKLILPPLYPCLKEDGEVVALIKPQFEAGKEQVGKNGVVRSSAVHKEVCCAIMEFASSIGFGVYGLDFSPIKGPKGNIEFLLYLRKNSGEDAITDYAGLADKILSSLSF
ncbi:MAG: TlyA family RNA methyltransferase [Clostridiales bacterium]|nr:TlyA family RNA methyltransferase [Clostridiales bacterium]